MKVHELPWWRRSEEITGYWRVISADQFSQELQTFPPSMELMDDFYKNYVAWFRLVPLKGGEGYILPSEKKNRSNKNTLDISFNVTLDRHKSFEVQVATLIHEGLHGIYRIGEKPQENHQLIHDTSKELAKRYHSKYSKFLEKIYSTHQNRIFIEYKQF